MIVADLSPQQLSRALAGKGLGIRTGPVVTRIRTPLRAVIEGVGLHYARHTVIAAEEFADFHVSVERPRNLRRWFGQQVVFRYDGQSPFEPLPGDQGFPLLEWGLNWCVYARCDHFLSMHCAVLERGGRALIMPAPSGSGKSTLCAGLAFRGWRLLSDELAVIDPSSCEVLPVPRPISLKNRSIDIIRGFAPAAVFGAVVPDTVKGSVCHVQPPADAVARGHERARPGWVVFPKYVAGAPARLSPLPKAGAFMELMRQAFNDNTHGREAFGLLADVVEQSDCYEFSYSELDDAVRVFDGLAAQGPLQR